MNENARRFYVSFHKGFQDRDPNVCFVLVNDCRMKKDVDQETGGNAGNWIGVGTAAGAALFALTKEPFWIALGVTLGAALDWRKPNQARDEYR